MNINNDDIILIQRYLDGTLNESEIAILRKLLLENAEARSTLRSSATVDLGLHDIAAGDHHADDAVKNETWSIPPDLRLRTTSSLQTTGWTRTLLAIAALAIVGLSTALWVQFQSSSISSQLAADRNIAKVAAIGGEVVWTGNGGSVSSELKRGALLTGGTIEAAGPRSYVALEFLDGSRVSVAGDSRLTFSDLGQKILYLKKGNMTSSVKPQDPEVPMLVHTRTAMLEVVGTEFKVESEFDATSLNVTEGKVRLKRLSDGQVVDVPANERVHAGEGHDLKTQPLPGFVTRWRSDLQKPEGVFGKWLPANEDTPPRIRLIHYRHTDPKGNTMMVMSCGLGMSGDDGERALFREDSKVRVRGFAVAGQEAVFGFATRTTNGEFGGNYISYTPDRYWIKLSSEIHNGDESGKLLPFEIVLDASDLLLSLELDNSKSEFQENPADLVVESFFGVAPKENFGLEISEVEVFRADDD